MIILASLFGRLGISAMFLIAGVAKLLDPVGGKRSLADFGVPAVATPAIATALPLLELLIAIALLPTASALIGALGALLLLSTFVAAIGANLAIGRTPECHCFGQLHSAPAGWPALTRNVLLAAVAGLIVWQGWRGEVPSLWGWGAQLTAFEAATLFSALAGLALLAAQLALMIQLLKQQGRILLRLEAIEGAPAGGETVKPEPPRRGLPLGASAPEFRLDGLRDKEVTLSALLAESKPALLLFTNPNCGPCQSLMPEVARWQSEYGDKLSIALVSEGTEADNVAKAAGAGITKVLLQKKREVAEAYQAWGTPAAVLIRPDGAIGSSVANGADAIRELVVSAIRSAPATPKDRQVARGARRGDPAPDLEMENIDGKRVSISAFRGGRTLLLFWNPACGYCRQMLDDLRDWDANPPQGAPSLVVVSSGSAEEGRAMALHAPVLLDPRQNAGAAFGAHGTPMALLLDQDGRIVSALAAGSQAVWQLASPQRVMEEVRG